MSSTFQTFVKIPDFKMDNETACKYIDAATQEAEIVFGLEGKKYVADRDYPEGSTVIHLPFGCLKPTDGRLLVVRFYPGCYLVARKVVTTMSGVEVHLESAYSKSQEKDVALPKAVAKGTTLLVALLTEFQLDVIDDPLIALWSYYQHTIICITARYRRQYFDRAEDLLAESYMYFMRAVRRLQNGSASRQNAPAFIASYLRDAPHNLLYNDWCIRPTRVQDKETGKSSLKGAQQINSLEYASPSDESHNIDFSNFVFYEVASEEPPVPESILYNFKLASTDETDRTIMEMVYQHYTYEEIGQALGGISRAAVQQRIARIRRNYTLLITTIPNDIAPTQEELKIHVERTATTATIYAQNCLAWDALRPMVACLVGAQLPRLNDQEKRAQKRLDTRLLLSLSVADRFFSPEERLLFPRGNVVKTFTYPALLKQLQARLS